MNNLKRACAYSVLKAMYEQEDAYHSLVDCFIPIVLQAIPQGETASLDDIKTNLSVLFPIPSLAIQMILDRAIEKNYVSYSEDDEGYSICSDVSHHYMEDEKNVEKRISALSHDIMTYFRDNAYIPTQPILDLIMSFIDRTSFLLQMKSTRPYSLTPIVIESEGHRKLVQYLKSKQEIEKNSVHLQTFLEIVKGAIVTEALGWTDIEHVEVGKYRNCKIFLDSNYIFSLCRWHSNQEYGAAEDLLELLKFMNFKLYIFDFTYVQILRVLSNYSPELAKQKEVSTTSVWGKLLQKGYDSDQIRKEAEGLKSSLTKKGIQIYHTGIHIEEGKVPADPETANLCNIYGKLFEERKPHYAEANYSFGKLHDFTSISIVRNLRGSDKTRLSDPKALFLSSDRRLADFNRYDMHQNHPESLPEVVLDTQMAGLLWFILKGREQSDFSLSVVLTAYARNLLVDENIWNKAWEILQKVLDSKHLLIGTLPHMFYLDLQSVLSNCKSIGDITEEMLQERIEVAYEANESLRKQQQETITKIQDQDNYINKLKSENEQLRETIEEQEITLGSLKKYFYIVCIVIIILAVVILMLAVW